MKASLSALVAGLVMIGGQAMAADMPVKAKAPPAAVPFFLFSDTTISYWHEFSAAEPAVGTGIPKEFITLTHVDAWRYGTNFVNIDFIKSSNKDPSAPWGGPGFPIPPGGIGDGAGEVYGFFRSTLGFNEIFNTKAFALGPIKDLSFYYGADWNTKNTAFAPQKRDVVAGLQLAFNVPGYLTVAAMYYKEWNHNGIIPLIGFPPGTTEDVEFDGALKIETAYMQPLNFFGNIPLRFSGFTNYTFEKGRDGFGVQTKPELLTDNRLTLDLGALTSNKPNWIDVFGGYRYWQNKFGSDHTLDFTGGSTESTWYLGVAWHAL